jgi:hypothetical protein
MPCNDACGDITLIENPVICELNARKRTLSNIGFYACSTSFPSPLEASGIAALLTSGEIVYSNELSNVTVNDPTTEELKISDCRPAQRYIASREITFQDRVAVEAPSGSPASTTPFFDYLFWANKTQNAASVYILWKFCDGDVQFARDANGNPLTIDILGYVNWDTNTNGAPRIEFKQFSAIFNGDPFNFNNTPAWNESPNGTVTVY